MTRFDRLDSTGDALRGAALTIGNFDGLHVGHQELVRRTRAAARQSGGVSALLTFQPHPVKLLAPKLAPPLICTPAQRAALLDATGLDARVEQPFDAAFAALTPAQFATLLFDTAGVRHVVVGHDFTYGRARAGHVGMLAEQAAQRGATVEVVPAVTVDGLVASSSKVREFVLEGNVTAAATLLGRPFALEGLVVRGAGRGRTIGVPTANVAAQNELLPALGVYAVRVTLPEGSTASGACNVGINPTFRTGDSGERREVSVEVHLLDQDRDLYGQPLSLQFVTRLRAERKFPSVEALVAQIQADLAAARQALAA